MEDVIYLNNAATSYPKAPPVAEAVARSLRDLPGAANRGGIEGFNVFDEARERLASLLGVGTPSQIALGPNSSWALNLGIFGLELGAGDTVLSTKAEHNSVLRPLYALSRRGIRVILLDCDGAGRIQPEPWREALSRYHPKLAVFSHASNVTGAVNDAAALTALAREAGALTLLDASQTCGWAPVRAGEWGVDLAAVTGHKYLLGPQGTGALYVRPGLTLTPHLLGGTGVLSVLDTMPEELPMHLEAGTGNEPGFHGLLAALDWAEAHPADIRQTERLTALLREGLRRAGAQVIVPEGPCTPVVSFSLPGHTPEEVAYVLTESYDVVCRSGLHCAPKIFPCLGMPRGTVRLSLSRFTTEEEIQTVIGAVQVIAHEL